jgi:predicted nucleic acid-binding protein
MILVDTSVWIRHFRAGCQDLEALLVEGEVWSHPFIVGELACGNLRDRSEVLTLLRELPTAQVASDEEVLSFIEKNHMYGWGIGLVDAHILASAELTDLLVWTFDKKLTAAATKLGISFPRRSDA